MIIYVNGAKEEFREYISLYLYFNSCISGSQSVKASYSFSIVDTNGSELHSHKSRGEGYTFQLNSNFSNWGIHKFVPSTDLYDKAFIQQDCLTIRVDIYEFREKLSRVTIVPVFDQTYFDITKGFNEFLTKREFTDLVIEVGMKKIDAHKIILCSASKVFKSMFESNLNENQNNRLKINDFDFEVVKAMITFLYSGKLESVDLYASELLVIADKYDIGSLKKYSEIHLIGKINETNVLQLLTLSQNCHCNDLENKCIEYIEENAKKVFKQKDWYNLD